MVKNKFFVCLNVHLLVNWNFNIQRIPTSLRINCEVIIAYKVQNDLLLGYLSNLISYHFQKQLSPPPLVTQT